VSTCLRPGGIGRRHDAAELLEFISRSGQARATETPLQRRAHRNRLPRRRSCRLRERRIAHHAPRRAHPGSPGGEGVRLGDPAVAPFDADDRKYAAEGGLPGAVFGERSCRC
jgi:hypothetical protein